MVHMRRYLREDDSGYSIDQFCVGPHSPTGEQLKNAHTEDTCHASDVTISLHQNSETHLDTRTRGHTLLLSFQRVPPPQLHDDGERFARCHHVFVAKHGEHEILKGGVQFVVLKIKGTSKWRKAK